MSAPLNQYQSVANVEQLDPDQLRTVVAMILEHLRLELVVEQTPDYETFTFRAREHA